MNYIDNNTLSELDLLWLRKFKASKNLDTLLIQVTGAERKIEQDSALTQREKFDNLMSINTAFCLRETEINSSPVIGLKLRVPNVAKFAHRTKYET